MSNFIDREEAISVVCKVCEVPNMYKCKGRNIAFKWCEEISKLLDLPTENQKKGKWIKTGNKIEKEPRKIWWFECSECGFRLTNPIDRTVYNYCPRCGSKMEATE